jgi:hypothetical protein
MNSSDEVRQVKTGVAALVVCLVRAMEKEDPHFQDRFLQNLSEAYYHFRDNSDEKAVNTLELLSWTREMLTGWNPITGQGEPFLK